MKFRMSWYYTILGSVGLLGGLTVLSISIYGIFTELSLRIMCVPVGLLGVFMFFDVFKKTKHRAYPWVSFSNNGVSVTWKFGIHANIPWKDCCDLGILFEDFSASRYHICRPWIYFSKVYLGYDRDHICRKYPELNHNQFIMVQYRPEVLDELLKYIDKDRIRNLHLLEK